MKATLVMADSVEVADNKLYVLGAGSTIVEAQTRPIALGVLFFVSPKEKDAEHAWSVELCDAAGSLTISDAGESVSIAGTFSIDDAPGYPGGVPMPVPIAINVGPLDLQPESRFQWVLKAGTPLTTLASAPFATLPAKPSS